MNTNGISFSSVIPAQAGIYLSLGIQVVDSRLRGNDGRRINPLVLVPLK